MRTLLLLLCRSTPCRSNQRLAVVIVFLFSRCIFSLVFPLLWLARRLPPPKTKLASPRLCRVHPSFSNVFFSACCALVVVFFCCWGGSGG